MTNRSRSSVLVNSRPVGSKCKTSWPHSPDSIHRVVDGATHESLLYDKGDSQVTSAAIEQVVDAARTDRSLTR